MGSSPTDAAPAEGGTSFAAGGQSMRVSDSPIDENPAEDLDAELARKGVS